MEKEESKAPSTNRRRLEGMVGKAIMLLLIVGSLFHIYTGGFGMLSTMSQRSLHLLFMLTPVFFLYSATTKGSKKLPWYDIAIGALVFAACLYLFFTWPRQTMRVGDPGFLDLFFGAVLILDGFGTHVPKPYIYFAMGFSVLVEWLNLLMRRKAVAHKVPGAGEW